MITQHEQLDSYEQLEFDFMEKKYRNFTERQFSVLAQMWAKLRQQSCFEVGYDDRRDVIHKAVVLMNEEQRRYLWQTVLYEFESGLLWLSRGDYDDIRKAAA